MSNRPSSTAAPILAVLAVVLVLYVVGYVATLDGVEDSHLSVRTGGSVTLYITHEPRYRFGQRWCEGLFWPIHQLDRRLRPELWDS